MNKQKDILHVRVLLITGLGILTKLAVDIQQATIKPILFFNLYMIIFIGFAYLLFKKNHILFSKILFLGMVNLLLAVMCSLLPKERWIVVYFFPLIAIAYAIFSDDDNKWRLLFIFLPSAFITILVLTDFNLLGGLKLPVIGSKEGNMNVNVIVSIVAISLCIDFLIKNTRESEKVLRNMTYDIQRKNMDLEKINGELDRFVYSTSHDLRAPLLSIQGLIKIALVETHDVTARDYLTKIADRACKLDDFIKEIIDYSRNARTELKSEQINLYALLTEVIDELKYIEGAERIQYSLMLSPDELLIGDRSRMKIVLSNLVSNAIKYHNPREANLWVKVSANREGNFCQLTISDNGIGIKPEFQNKIFDMFFRATDKSTGSGLGLFIVKEIVTKIGGSIALTSVYGKGSDFLITLPVTENENEQS